MSRRDEERLTSLLKNHVAYTDSGRAKEILDNWAEYRTRFVKVMPVEYRRAIREMERGRMLQAAE
jgi:glutamate synthase (NADPH/NADH) large chain